MLGPDDESRLRQGDEAPGRADEADAHARIVALGTLGQSHLARGETDEACAALTQALMLADLTGAAPESDVALLLAELSRIHLAQSSYALAEPLLERLLAIKVQKGTERPEVATVLASLAAVRMALGGHAAAEGLYRRALQIREKTLPPNHLATAATMEALSETCAARGHFADALTLSRRALTMREANLGADDPTVREARGRIADLLLQAPDGSSTISLRSTPSSHPAQVSTSLASYAPELVALQREMTYAAPTPSRASVVLQHQTEKRERSRTVAGVVVIVAVLGGIGITSQLRGNSVPEFAEAPPPVTRMGAAPLALPPAASPPVGATQGSEPPVTSHAREKDPEVAAAFAAAAAPVTRKPATSAEPEPVPPRTLPKAIVPPIALPDIAAPRVDALPSRNLTDSFPGGVSSGLSRSASARSDADAPTPPRLIGTPPQPRYPELLRDLRLQGEVLVQFVVGENGVPDVATMQVLRSPHAALTDAVRTALKQFRFEPARVGGRPRAETVKYGFTFHAPGR